MRATGVAAGLGCSIVATVVVCILGGILLDRKFGTEPWLTLAGVGLAVAAAGYQLYELSMLGRHNVRPGVLTRNIERIIPAGRGRGESNPDQVGPTGAETQDRE